MSARLNASTDSLYRVTPLPSATPVTITLRVYLVSDRNTGSILCQLINNAGTIYQDLRLGSDGTQLALVTSAGTTLGSQLSVGQWYHLAFVRNGTSFSAYINGVLDISATYTVSLTPGGLLLGGNTTSSYSDARFQDVGVWSAALSQSDIQAEMNSVGTWARSANLWAYYPLTSDANDIGGNTRHLTAVSIDWEANYSAGISIIALAILTTAPSLELASISQNHNVSAPNITTVSPTLAAALVQQLHALIVTAPSQGPPVVESTVLLQKHFVLAEPIYSGLSIDSSAFSQSHNLNSQDANSTPFIEVTALLQHHVISANDILSQAPILGTPTISGQIEFSAQNIEVIPFVEIAILSQTHIFAGSSLSSQSFVEIPSVQQNQQLAGALILTSAPVLENPEVFEFNGFSAHNITATPILDSAIFSQNHLITAVNIALSSIITENAALTQNHLFVFENITTQPPIVEQGSLSGTILIEAEDLFSGTPFLENILIAQKHGLEAENLFSISPHVQQTQILQRHYLIADILVTDSPILQTPFFSLGERPITRRTLKVSRLFPVFVVQKEEKRLEVSRKQAYYEIN